MTLSPDFVTNKLVRKSRWFDLYRKIYNFFLKRDFIHKLDYLIDIQELNARIKTLETKINQMDQAIAAHTHLYIAPAIPASTVPTAPAIAGAPPYIAQTLVMQPVVHKDTNLNNQDAAQMGLPAATAPVGDGVSPESQLASIQARQDIGV